MILDWNKIREELFRRVEGYAAGVAVLFERAFKDILDLVLKAGIDPKKPFTFESYGLQKELEKILRKLYSQTYYGIQKGIENEWSNSNDVTDDIIRYAFGKKSIPENLKPKLFARNKVAMDAFIQRKIDGMDLSKRVWNLTAGYKEELEMVLDLAIGEGTPAMKLASRLKKYLNEPDIFFRRFRVKIGEDEDGNPVYGRKWKRRIYDNEAKQYRWIDANPKDYHPGMGVYRSSARNAQRLARTETNMAYRQADHERWSQLPFVKAIKVELSNNPNTCEVCERLAGEYSASFVFIGWHPHCRCFAVAVLSSREELDNMVDAILDGGDPWSVPVEGRQTDLPDNFKEYLLENQERLQRAEERGKVPYFIDKNRKEIYKSNSLTYRR